MVQIFIFCAIGLAFASFMCVFVLAMRRVFLGHSENKRLGLEHRVAPLALDVTYGFGSEIEATLSDDERTALAGVLRRYARQLSGEAQQQITEFFERTGLVARELSRLEHSLWFNRRAQAARALGDMGSNSAIKPLMFALANDPSMDVRSACARSLGELQASEAVGDLVDAFAIANIPRLVSGGALLAIGPSSLEGLLGLRKSEDPAVRRSVCELLGWLGGPSDSSALRQALHDPDSSVRTAASASLARLGSSNAAQELCDLAVIDDDPEVRLAASRALGMLGDRSSILALVDRIESDEFDVAREAAHSLGRIAPQDTVKGASENPDNEYIAEVSDLIQLGLL
jgi:hypothetical protein